MENLNFLLRYAILKLGSSAKFTYLHHKMQVYALASMFIFVLLSGPNPSNFVLETD